MSYTKFQLICLQNYEIFAVNQSPLPAFLQEAFFCHLSRIANEYAGKADTVGIKGGGTKRFQKKRRIFAPH